MSKISLKACLKIFMDSKVETRLDDIGMADIGRFPVGTRILNDGGREIAVERYGDSSGVIQISVEGVVVNDVGLKNKLELTCSGNDLMQNPLIKEGEFENYFLVVSQLEKRTLLVMTPSGSVAK